MTDLMASRGRSPGDHNPFSTRFTRPGAIPYIFSPGTSCNALRKRLAELSWTAQVIGPHGSGKSTLIHQLSAAFAQVDREVVLVTLNDRQRKLPITRTDSRLWNDETLVIIDGFEQLNWWNRLWLQQICGKRRAGLLVTAHTDVGLPTLEETTVCLKTAKTIVAHLSTGQCPVADDLLADYLRKHNGNMREVLFGLYDQYEQIRHNSHDR